MKANQTARPMGPLERELKRRRRQAGRLIAVAGTIVIGSAAIVVPSVTEHREAAAELQSELEAAARPLRQSSQVQAFEVGCVHDLASAERSITTLAPDEPLPSDFRTRFRDRLVRLGFEVLTIEIEDLIYLGDTDDTEAPEPPFVGTPVKLQLNATTSQVDELVKELSNDPRPGLVTRLKIERKKDSVGQVAVEMTITFMHLNPSRESGMLRDTEEENS